MQWKPNTTVAAVAEREGRFLLVEELIKGKKTFNQPAGHLEQGESILDAVKRETLEETARDFRPDYLTGIYLYPAAKDKDITYLRFCFFGQCLQEYPERELDTGIIQAVWLTRDEIIRQQDRLRSPMVLRCIDDYLAGQRFSLDLLYHDSD